MAKERKQITPASEVYQEDVIASGLIPNLDPGHLQYIGKNWFKDGVTGTVYHFIKDEAGVLTVKETRQSKTSAHPTVKTPTPKIPKEPKVTMVDILCIDCGATRTIHLQDKFQVKRCVSCQKVHRNQVRSARIKAKKVPPTP